MSQMRSASGRVFALMVAAAVLYACSGGGTKTAGIDGSGVLSPVVTQGPIQGFGSVVLNGRHYSLASAQITVDGAASSEADLAVGQLVTVTGSVDSAGGEGVADTVEFDANVEGPVQSVDVAAGTLLVLGQQVTTDADTVFDMGSAGTDLTALAVGDFVKVSGLVSPAGVIRATWIKRETAAGTLRVVGRVSGLDAALLRFDVNGLVVDYSAAGVIDGFASGAPRDGDRVRVEGASLAASGVLIADSVQRLESRLGEHEGDGAEVEGLITRFASETDFDVAGQPITTDSATVYEGGTAASLKLDVKVQVEGAVNADGVILAHKIEVKDGGSVGSGEEVGTGDP